MFSIWVPDTFPTMATVKQILNANAITALAALSITIPLAARVFDLSFAYTMTLTGVITAHFLAVGVPLVPALLLGLGAGRRDRGGQRGRRRRDADRLVHRHARDRIADPALITMATGDTAIISTKLQGGFAKIGQTNVSGFTLPVVYVLVVAVAMWFLLEHTATGRRLYATGFNPDASKLAGVRVDRLRFMSLVVSGSLAGATGLVLASTIGSGDPTAGTSYLLPAFAAAFLGATQLKHGRFNAFGTLIAVLLLGTGTTGLGARERAAVVRRHVRRGRADRVARRDRHPASSDRRRRREAQAAARAGCGRAAADRRSPAMRARLSLTQPSPSRRRRQSCSD